MISLSTGVCVYLAMAVVFGIECLWVDHPENLREGVMRWDGMLQLQEVSEKAFFAQPKAAISAYEADPHRTYTKVMTSSSPRSWQALLARGSGTSSKADRKMCMMMTS
jgi:hypothetical protein